MVADNAWFVYWVTVLLVGTCAVVLVMVAVGMLFLDWRGRRVIRGRHRSMGQISSRHEDDTGEEVSTSLGVRAIHRRRRRALLRSSQGARAAGRRPTSA